MAAYLPSGDVPEGKDDANAPTQVEATAQFVNDPDYITRAHYCLTNFHMLPDELDRQEESVMDDLIRMNKQVKYREWAFQVDIDPDEDLEPLEPVHDPDFVDYRAFLGLPLQ